MAYRCIANAHEGSQSRLEASRGLIVGHFISDLDLECVRPGLRVNFWSHSSILTSSVAPTARLVPRGDRFWKEMLNKMTAQRMSVKRRLIANRVVPAL